MFNSLGKAVVLAGSASCVFRQPEHSHTPLLCPQTLQAPGRESDMSQLYGMTNPLNSISFLIVQVSIFLKFYNPPNFSLILQSPKHIFSLQFTLLMSSRQTKPMLISKTKSSTHWNILVSISSPGFQLHSVRFLPLLSN